ncbi:ABC transporter ATP-binding protein [bacterium]|nr:ABC transporter ATP-binding protein [bacterium]
MLKIHNVSKAFKNNDKSVNVLENINLFVEKQEILSLVGQSGCGKSTLLRIISGLEKATSGHVKLYDEIITKPSSNIAMVFQDPRLMPWLNVFDNIKLSILNDNKETQKFKINNTLKKVGLENSGNLWPRQLSGGMAQRVAIARALVQEPKVLLLDEPFSALDSFTKTNLHEHVKDLWSSLKITIVMVTHDINEATGMSDRILVLQKPVKNRVSRNEIIKINQPRSSYKNDEYNELIKNCIFNTNNVPAAAFT